ncbi:hypothetical protein B0H14DRAFT_3143688 [Mycena olivaceomarginata]|nr:hypothetical protein B0H14DRAFT_3143688 [Mycena olivaceomarginata]
MAPSATFCNIPLSTSVDSSSATSRVSLNWILSAGISAPGSVASGILTLPCGDTLSVTSTLPYDVVLGRDWLLFCRETLPHTSLDLSSGSVSPGHRPPPPVDQCGHPDSNSSAMDVDAQPCAATPLANPSHQYDFGTMPTCSPPSYCHRSYRMSSAIPGFQHELYSKLTEGSLVLLTVSFATYLMANPGRKTRKVYHVLVDRLKILYHGDGDAWDPPVPALPEPLYLACDTQETEGRCRRCGP